MQSTSITPIGLLHSLLDPVLRHRITFHNLIATLADGGVPPTERSSLALAKHSMGPIPRLSNKRRSHRAPATRRPT